MATAVDAWSVCSNIVLCAIALFSSHQLFKAFSGRNGDGGESDQASKKWENRKKKYKDLRTPKTGVGD
ncbi:unnamed protein product [Arctogadus glacialis]